MILGLHQNINSCYFILFLVSSLTGFIDHLVSNTIQREFQGTLDLHAKMPYLQQYPSKLCLIKYKYKSMFFFNFLFLFVMAKSDCTFPPSRKQWRFKQN